MRPSGTPARPFSTPNSGCSPPRRTPTTAGLAGPAVAAALDGYEALTGRRLDPGQRHLVTSFAARSTLLAAGLGPAGSGKTTAMRALAHVLASRWPAPDPAGHLRRRCRRARPRARRPRRQPAQVPARAHPRPARCPAPPRRPAARLGTDVCPQSRRRRARRRGRNGRHVRPRPARRHRVPAGGAGPAARRRPAAVRGRIRRCAAAHRPRVRRRGTDRSVPLHRSRRSRGHPQAAHR